MAPTPAHGHISLPPALGARVNQLLCSSLAPGSRRHYAKELQKFMDFCKITLHKDNWFPATPSTLAGYIAHLFDKGYASASIHTATSAIAFFHKLTGAHDLSRSFFIQRLLLGVKKQRPSCDTRAPVTANFLRKLIAATGSSAPDEYSAHLLRAMYSLAYYALLRISEMASSGRLARHVLHLSNISISAKRIRVTFVSYKHSRGKPFCLSIPARSSPVCPVLHVSRYLSLRGNAQGPLFVFPGSSQAVSTAFFNAQLRASVTAASLDKFHITSHSFRIGRACDLMEQGMNESNIKVMGRWNSDAYKSYVRVDNCSL